MSLAADAIVACHSGTSRADRANLNQKIRFETEEARRIQKQTGCSWSEALRIVGKMVIP